MVALGAATSGVLLAWISRKNAASGSFVIEPILVFQNGKFLKMFHDRLGSPSRLLEDVQELAGAKSIKFELQKTSGCSTSRENKLNDRAAGWAAAAVDAAIPAAQAWSLWHSVDRHIFQAFEHLSHQQIDGVADVLRLIDAKGYAIETAGFTHKLLGHLGEWHVQEHMIQAGMPVAMPFGSNEPGLDMWVGEHAVNVKTVADAGGAAAGHFADYPHIPIVVPSDAAHIPADALHFDPTHGLDPSMLRGDHLTVVDDALRHADMVAHTDHALNVLGDPGPHLHFPYVTMAVSGFREARLLISGNTDVERAVKNVAVDTVAVGGGGAIGMKTGAAFGVPFGPLGIMLGGLIGGAIGAAAGRAGANVIKSAPLEESKRNYEYTLQRYSEKEKELTAEASAQWKQEQNIIERHIQEYAESEKASQNKKLTEAHEQLTASLQVNVNQAKQYFDLARSSVEKFLREEKEQLKLLIPPLALPWSGFFEPGLTSALLRHSSEFSNWRENIDSLLAQWNGTPEEISHFFDLVLAVPTGAHLTSAYLNKVRTTRVTTAATMGQSLQESMSRMVAKRENAVSQLREKWSRISGLVEQEIAPYVASLRRDSDHFRSELRKAGIEA